MPVGVGICGFTNYELPDIVADFETDFVALIPSLDVASDTPMGQIIGVMSDRLASVWDAMQAVYGAFDPDKAEDASQDAVAALTGSTRLAASKSFVKQSMALTNGTSVPAGSIVASTTDTSIRFVLVGPEPAPGDVVVPGPVVATSTATFYGRFEAENTGPVPAAAGTLTTIVTPVSGWSTTTNAADAAIGRDIEKSPAFRNRREAELAAEGSSPIDATRAELLRLDGMQQADVFENTGDTVDANGLPPHSIECLVFDGVSPVLGNNTIAQVIWKAKAGGIETYGATTATATDAKGGLRSVKFTRPTQKTVYFTIDIVVNSEFPTDGDAAIKDAMVTRGEVLFPGDDVILSTFYPAVFSIPGVVDLPTFRAGFTASPAGVVNLAIAARELATFDTSRIVVNHV